MEKSPTITTCQGPKPGGTGGTSPSSPDLNRWTAAVPKNVTAAVAPTTKVRQTDGSLSTALQEVANNKNRLEWSSALWIWITIGTKKIWWFNARALADCGSATVLSQRRMSSQSCIIYSKGFIIININIFHHYPSRVSPRTFVSPWSTWKRSAGTKKRKNNQQKNNEKIRRAILEFCLKNTGTVFFVSLGFVHLETNQPIPGLKGPASHEALLQTLDAETWRRLFIPQTKQKKRAQYWYVHVCWCIYDIYTVYI